MTCTHEIVGCGLTLEGIHIKDSILPLETKFRALQSILDKCSNSNVVPFSIAFFNGTEVVDHRKQVQTTIS